MNVVYFLYFNDHSIIYYWHSEVYDIISKK